MLKGDFSRNTFHPFKDFTRVLMQQGRLQLDADWNEQVSIFWHFLHTLTRDLLGPYAGPEDDCGFGVLAPGDFPLGSDSRLTEEEQDRLKNSIRDNADFLVGPGNYYVHGILCNNPHYFHYSKQAYHQGARTLRNNKSPYLIYLDVSERDVPAAEDNSICEVALNGADTAERAKIMWQVKSFDIGSDPKSPFANISDSAAVMDLWPRFVDLWQPKNRGLLRARAHSSVDAGYLDPSTVAPASRYRGPQNQLYRVEIHRGGVAGQKDPPTFKWSRENGSVVFPIISMTGHVLTLGHLGRDLRSGLQVGDWVEIADEISVHQRRANPLRQVDFVDVPHRKVTLRGDSPASAAAEIGKHAILRRWDQKQGDSRHGGLDVHDGGAALVKESGADKIWLGLEDGIQVQFAAADPPNLYRPGDYWLIPARVATGDVEWPSHGDEPAELPPEGIEHCYAPLALVEFNAAGALYKKIDCRPKFRIPISF
jgi:hypothetical protein